MGTYSEMAGTLKALAHPVRLQILEALRAEEACVCHLEALLGLRQAYISQQLARLREGGLVMDRREGLNVYYALAEESVGVLLDAARATVVSLAAADGRAINLVEPRGEPEACPCPKCENRTRPTLAEKVHGARDAEPA